MRVLTLSPPFLIRFACSGARFDGKTRGLTGTGTREDTRGLPATIPISNSTRLNIPVEVDVSATTSMSQTSPTQPSIATEPSHMIANIYL